MAQASFRSSVYSMKPSDFKPTQTGRIRVDEIRKAYGIDDDIASIKAGYDTSTNAAFAGRYEQQRQNELQLDRDIYGRQSDLLGNMRRAQSAIASGASAGLAGANEVSALLGTQQEAIGGQTQMALEKNLIGKEQAAQLAANQQLADQERLARQQFMGNMDAQLYGFDTQFDAAQMDFHARNNASIYGLQGSVYGADQQRAGMEAQAAATRAMAAAQSAVANMPNKYQDEVMAAANSGNWGMAESLIRAANPNATQKELENIMGGLKLNLGTLNPYTTMPDGKVGSYGGWGEYAPVKPQSGPAPGIYELGGSVKR